MKFQYQTQGTCCKLMNLEIENNIIKKIDFIGGCDGNLKGLKVLLEGMDIDTVIKKFQGLPCGSKSTSCPDQLAKCLIEYHSKIKDSNLV